MTKPLAWWLPVFPLLAAAGIFLSLQAWALAVVCAIAAVGFGVQARRAAVREYRDPAGQATGDDR